MKRSLLPSLLLSVSLNSCTTEPKRPEQTWHETTLSPELLQKVEKQTAGYKTCVNHEMIRQGTLDDVDIDSRAATDIVLKACEPELTPIREWFLAEGVPAPVAERYLKRKRTQAARGVLLQMMRISALRQRQQEDAQTR